MISALNTGAILLYSDIMLCVTVNVFTSQKQKQKKSETELTASVLQVKKDPKHTSLHYIYVTVIITSTLP